MHFPTTFIAFIVAASGSSAVTIRNYRTGTCKDTYAQCANVRPQICCVLAHNRVYSSSLFLGLPATAIGVICASTGSKDCGTVKKSGHGLTLCLGDGNSKGSYWFDCRSCSRRTDGGLAASGEIQELNVSSLGDVATVIGSATPDIIAFDGHQFGINNTTPQGVIDTLFQYFEVGADYVDIPANLKVYEVTGSDDDE